MRENLQGTSNMPALATAPTVAIIGASRDRSKFGNKSVRAHQAAGYQVFPVNPKDSEVEGLACVASVADLRIQKIDRVSLYLPPAIAVKVLDELASLDVDEVWLNPCVAYAAVRERAPELVPNASQGCSIADLGMSPSEFS